MTQYQLVEKHDIQHHNEYYELRTTQTDDQKSVFFTTNEENLEDVAADIAQNELSGVTHYTIVPHRKDS